MGYNQHQSFHLRDRWLTKAFNNLQQDPYFFMDSDAFEKIGLGKNMVQSLKYWVQAFNLYEFNKRTKEFEITPFGEFILNYDKSLRFKNTLVLLHYQLAINSDISNSWYWFFNECDEHTINKEDAINKLKKWAEHREKKEITINSIKRDIDCLIRTYIAKPNEDDPEDIIFSPLYKLNLLEEYQDVIVKKEAAISKEHFASFAYCILDYCEKRNLSSLLINEVVNKSSLPGKILNLKRNSIITLLTEWEQHPEFKITLTRTNNLDSIVVPKISALNFLEYEYRRGVVNNNG